MARIAPLAPRLLLVLAAATPLGCADDPTLGDRAGDGSARFELGLAIVDAAAPFRGWDALSLAPDPFVRLRGQDVQPCPAEGDGTDDGDRDPGCVGSQDVVFETAPIRDRFEVGFPERFTVGGDNTIAGCALDRLAIELIDDDRDELGGEQLIGAGALDAWCQQNPGHLGSVESLLGRHQVAMSGGARVTVELTLP